MTLLLFESFFSANSEDGSVEETIEKYKPVFRRHGFHDYLFDFSSANTKAIEVMAQALLKMEQEDKIA